MSPWAALIVAAVAAGAAPPVAGQTLTEALAQAYQTNPQLLAERARLRATDEGVSQAVSNWRPTVTLGGDLAKERTESDSGFSEGVNNREPWGYDLTVRQNLYRGGRTRAATKQAKNLVELDRARLLSVEQTVLLNTVQEYVDVVRNQAEVDLNVNNVNVLRRQLEATRDRFRVGEVTRTDVAQAESRLARAIADRTVAEGNLIQSRAGYTKNVGQVPGKLAPAKPLAGMPENQDEAVSAARKFNFDVIQADFGERAARNEIDAVFGELLPLVTLTGQFSENHNTIGESSRSEAASLTARVSVPLYQSGAVSSRLREAKQTAAQRRNERNLAIREAVETATRSWESLERARAQIRSFTAEVRAARIALEGVEQEALVGSRTVLDVLDAEQELLTARVSLVRAQRDEVFATYQLKAAMGQLTAKDLGLPVKIYDYKRHYDRVRHKWFGLRVQDE